MKSSANQFKKHPEHEAFKNLVAIEPDGRMQVQHNGRLRSMHAYLLTCECGKQYRRSSNSIRSYKKAQSDVVCCPDCKQKALEKRWEAKRAEKASQPVGLTQADALRIMM